MGPILIFSRRKQNKVYFLKVGTCVRALEAGKGGSGARASQVEYSRKYHEDTKKENGTKFVFKSFQSSDEHAVLQKNYAIDANYLTNVFS